MHMTKWSQNCIICFNSKVLHMHNNFIFVLAGNSKYTLTRNFKSYLTLAEVLDVIWVATKGRSQFSMCSRTYLYNRLSLVSLSVLNVECYSSAAVPVLFVFAGSN